MDEFWGGIVGPLLGAMVLTVIFVAFSSFLTLLFCGGG